jgi:hypothetical protein
MSLKAAFTNKSEMKSDHSFEVHLNDEVQAGSTEKPAGLTGFKYWAKHLAVETGGIERVTDEDRAVNTSKMWNACTFWYATNIYPTPTEI